MRQIDVTTTSQNYPILFLPLDATCHTDVLKSYLTSEQVFIITNKTVAAIYLDFLRSHLSGIKIEVFFMDDGEQFKNYDTYKAILDVLISTQQKRNSTIIALGGGVVGDMAGFVAATYQRGVNYIQVPTTLLAMVDSAVGGKTAINHELGKNMIGAFYQPSAVLTDVKCLSSLPARELKAGLAEVIKYALLCGDATLLEFLELNCSSIRGLEAEVLTELVARCCKIKANIVEQDEKETGIRATLNLGHTFGHALERLGEYKHLLHGEAVAVGTMMAFDLALQLDYISKDYHRRVESLYGQFEISTICKSPWRVGEVIDVMRLDKKNQSKKIRLVLPKDVGRVTLVDFNDETLLCEVILKRLNP